MANNMMSLYQRAARPPGLGAPASSANPFWQQLLNRMRGGQASLPQPMPGPGFQAPATPASTTPPPSLAPPVMLPATPAARMAGPAQPPAPPAFAPLPFEGGMQDPRKPVNQLQPMPRQRMMANALRGQGAVR